MNAEWRLRNERRLDLIAMDRDRGGLSADDRAELTRLQGEVFDALDAAMPLPFGDLERMEARVKAIQARIDLDG